MHLDQLDLDLLNLLLEEPQAGMREYARVLGVADRVGRLAPGMAADLLLLDDDLELRAVMQGGRWVRRAGADG